MVYISDVSFRHHQSVHGANRLYILKDNNSVVFVPIGRLVWLALRHDIAENTRALQRSLRAFFVVMVKLLSEVVTIHIDQVPRSAPQNHFII